MRRLGSLDGSAYLRAFGLLVRVPQIALAPLLATIVALLLTRLFSAGSGGFVNGANAGLAGLIGQLVESFGLAVALIVADFAWRRGRALFDDAWDEARRRAGDILFAALGLSFVVYVAQLIGSFLGVAGLIVMQLLAYFFFVYTLPAAAIGGVPGGGALNVSVERAKAAPLPTLAITIVYVLALGRIPSLVLGALEPVIATSPLLANAFALDLLFAAVRAIVLAYVALVLAKSYADLSYGRSSRW